MPSAETTSSGAEDELAPARDAFRELHGRRLHGFALLLTLGDRARAARLAGEALADGCRRIDVLRHPERAAAWLRARVLARAWRTRRHDAASADVLAGLGVDAATLAGLAVLDRRERAAVIARTVEGLDLRDVATIAGRDGRRLERLMDEAVRRYAAAATEVRSGPRSAGPIGQRLDEAVRRAIA